ncbi:Carboxypeptidase T precursor [compost metagenome]
MIKTWHPMLSGLCISLSLAGCSLGGQMTDLRGVENENPTGMSAAAAKLEATRSEVILNFKSLAQLDALATAGVDLFENVDRERGTVGATINKDTAPILQKLGVTYTMKQSTVKGGFPSGYQSVEQVYADMKATAAAHPDFIQYVEFGKSLETVDGKASRPMAALRFTSKRDAKLPAVRIGSGIHARELPPVELTSRLFHLLADGYGKDPAITKLVDTKDIWIVPLQNPDGRVRVEKGSAMWRKNTRKNNAFSEGVDCNRNGDDHWEQGSSNSSADDYHGAAPFSEPESQAIRDLAGKVKFDTSIDVHCYGGMILWPPGFDNSVTADEASFSRIGGAMGKKLGYKAGTIARTIYKTYGDLATWEYGAHKTLAFAAELDTNGFNPGYAEVDRQWAKWKDTFLFLISETGAPRGALKSGPQFLIR